ncbi:MAG TPA: N-ethylammeline chlorohydrolase [Chloroflexi bacterium]|jgi:5-methylthioadenosine/S-adenosylhomocysteine deaminase|nr:N-ethylammeline chlorohydrolase [Chloroflexota bacterium]
MKTLITGAVILTCDDQMSVLEHADLVMDGGRISFVGERYEGEYDIRLPVSGKLLLPGLINAHTHSGMSLFRSLADDVDLRVFLEDRVWPCEVNLTPDDVYVGSVLSSIEMLKCGVTTSVDMYFFEDELMRAALETGARTLITPTILDVPTWTRVLGSWEDQLRRALDFASANDGLEGRVHTGIGPHAPYTVPLDALSLIAEEARRIGRPLNIHLVETELERDSFNGRGAGSTACVLEEIGFFDGPVIAAHSIWIDHGDIEIYARKRVGVAHCPQSNAKLAAGIAPIADMLRGGVNVGLGTDGAATNNNHDMWAEMRLAAVLQKVSAGDPKLLPAGEALSLATRVGAQAVHLDNLGVLREGFRADVVTLDIADTLAVPVFSPATYVSHAVYSFGAQLVDSVWVEGRQVVKNGDILSVDEEAARRALQKAALEIAERTGAVPA